MSILSVHFGQLSDYFLIMPLNHQIFKITCKFTLDGEIKYNFFNSINVLMYRLLLDLQRSLSVNGNLKILL